MPLSQFKPHNYGSQLQSKHEALLEALKPWGLCDAEVHASEPTHYRMRAEFRIWHEGDRCDYVMFRPEDPRHPLVVNDFPIASHTINRVMPLLLEAVNHDPLLKQRLYQVEFLSSTTEECLITLVYHKALGDDWQATATLLAQRLGAHIIGRSRGKKRVIGQDYITERLTIDQREWVWRQPEGAFTQPNAGINQHMLHWATRMLSPIDGDLLELYCGIGNFTLPLSAVCPRVLATEVNKAACRAALHNIETNQCSNIALARLSSEEMTSALRGERPFRRLAEIDLGSYDFKSLLVDPPRAGLDPATRELARRFPNILYISCNPETLFRDVAELASTHTVTQAALFDQFPYTHHMECGLLLQGRQA